MPPKNKLLDYLSIAGSDRVMLITLGKVGLSLVLIALVGTQLITHLETFELKEVLDGHTFSMPLLASVCLLMLANWGIEVLKWKKLISGFSRITFGTALRSVLSGVALAIVTPARLGEYAGRLLGIEAADRAKAVLANGVGSIAQNIANISLGLVATVAYASMFLGANKSTIIALIGISLAVLGILLLVLSRLDVFALSLHKYKHKPWIASLIKQAAFLGSYNAKDMLVVLGLSYSRYFVYAIQYVILVLICGVTSSPTYALIGVSVIFFIQSGIPLPPVLSVLARGELAIFIWAVFSDNVPAILSATFLLWFINLLVPAIVGALLIMKSKTSE